MRQVMVRYRLKPECVAENEELVRAVYEGLGRTRPGGVRYATFNLDDRVVTVLDEVGSYRLFEAARSS